jgi:hypothetical protein
VTARKGALLLLVASCAWAQLDLWVVGGGPEGPVRGTVDIGGVDAGNALEVGFLVRNSGPDAVSIQTLTVAGAAFTLARRPALPHPLEPGATVDFAVRFLPGGPGSYSALASLNGLTFLILASARPGIAVWLDYGPAKTLLGSGTAVDFGTVERGSRSSRRVLLENSGSGPLSATASIAGDCFRLAAGGASELPAGGLLPLEIAFEPNGLGAAEGLLQVNERSFPLRGVGTEPPVPKPQLFLNPQMPRSGQQATASVRLPYPSPKTAAGRLRLEFVPAVPYGGGDAAIQFLATASRSADFSIQTGESAARFGGRTEIEFQTGTTAGTLVLTAEWDSQAAEARLALPPVPVAIDSARLISTGEGLEVKITGFDNSRSISQLGFTFFDGQERPVAPGRIALDATADFRRWFETSGAGGVFSLRAVFPVEGDASGIAAAEVEFTNSAGTTRSGRIGIASVN